MDPIAQLGWGNRRGEVEGPATRLVRDALHAADLMHEDAMSEIGENNSSGDECDVGVLAAGEELHSHSTEHSTGAVSVMDGEPPG